MKPRDIEMPFKAHDAVILEAHQLTLLSIRDYINERQTMNAQQLAITTLSDIAAHLNTRIDHITQQLEQLNK